MYDFETTGFVVKVECDVIGVSTVNDYDSFQVPATPQVAKSLVIDATAHFTMTSMSSVCPLSFELYDVAAAQLNSASTFVSISSSRVLVDVNMESTM